jgi:hypothetical protein
MRSRSAQRPSIFLKHPLKQLLSRSRWDSGCLELEHFLSLAPYLDAHAFDFGPYEVEVRP